MWFIILKNKSEKKQKSENISEKMSKCLKRVGGKTRISARCAYDEGSKPGTTAIYGGKKWCLQLRSNGQPYWADIKSSPCAPFKNRPFSYISYNTCSPKTTKRKTTKRKTTKRKTTKRKTSKRSKRKMSK